jgi:hypothetical protein
MNAFRHLFSAIVAPLATAMALSNCGGAGNGTEAGEESVESAVQALKTTFSPVPYFGSTANYAPLTSKRWTVATDAGDARYFLETSSYSGLSNARLGEYSIVKGRTYLDSIVDVTARSAEKLPSNPAANYAVIFGWVDSSNYNYMLFSAAAASTQLVAVTAGKGAIVATATRAGITDTAYHAIQLWRFGGWIRVLVDGAEILSATASTQALDMALRAAGAVGVGSYDDSAYFDDIDVVDYAPLVTPHFQVSVPSTALTYADSVTSLLENGYALYVANTRQDVNARLSNGSYAYVYRPAGWQWWNDPNGILLPGGLTSSGGPSAVQESLLPESRNASTDDNEFLSVSFHELGNGWALPGDGVPLPPWLTSESHSGFLRAEGELDLGYCHEANNQHAAHLASYEGTPLDQRRMGNSVEPLLVTLVEKYGWPMFRSLYATATSGGFAYLSGLSDNDRDNEAVIFLSQQAGESLISFLQGELGITPNQKALDALIGLPSASLSILQTLPCHPQVVHATPSALSIGVTSHVPTGTGTVYVAGPGAWTARLTHVVGKLTMTRASAADATTLSFKADLTGLAQGSVATATLVIETASGSPLQVPITAQVLGVPAGPVANPSFEDGSSAPTSWSTGAFLSGSTNVAFGWTTKDSHVGKKSVTITNLVPNDSNWAETVTGLVPGKSYVLSGWMKAKNAVAPGPAANINIYGTFAEAGASGTFDWTKFSVQFVPSTSEVSVACRLGFFGSLATGEIWCDDIQVQPVP